MGALPFTFSLGHGEMADCRGESRHRSHVSLVHSFRHKNNYRYYLFDAPPFPLYACACASASPSAKHSCFGTDCCCNTRYNSTQFLFSFLAIAIPIPFLSIHTAGSFHCGPLAQDELTVSPHVSQWTSKQELTCSANTSSEAARQCRVTITHTHRDRERERDGTKWLCHSTKRNEAVLGKRAGPSSYRFLFGLSFSRWGIWSYSTTIFLWYRRM